jgi:hypothetical protein
MNTAGVRPHALLRETISIFLQMVHAQRWHVSSGSPLGLDALKFE